MEGRRTYSTRSAAVRAARNACKKALGSTFCAYEGHDYGIHPDCGRDALGHGVYGLDRFYFELRGPALDASKENQ